MKKILLLGLILILLFSPRGIQGPSIRALGENSDLFQFNNLTIQDVSSRAGLTILTAAPSGSSSCIRFQSVDSEIGVTVECPKPATLTYSVEIDSNTKLLLRTREPGKTSDFVAGDKINAFGLYNQIFSQKDGAVRAIIVRNLSRPELKRFVQLDEVELVSSVSSTPNNLVVIQRKLLPCYDFGFNQDYKKPFPCPLGLSSFSESAVSQNIKPPEFLASIIQDSRKYIINILDRTSILGKTRKPFDLSQFSVGDRLNIYGLLGSDNSILEAQVIRSLVKSKEAPLPSNYEGVIYQIRSGAETILLRLRDGRIVEMPNPFQPGTFLSVRGILDEIKGTISNVSSLNIKGKETASDLPVISLIEPGSGTVGTRVTVKGSGFNRTVNDINFGNIPRAVRNLPSPDRNTLNFVIPSASPCPPDVFCERKLLAPGLYPLSIVNASGTSDSSVFEITALPPFSIITESSLPQIMQNRLVDIPLEARGGTDSYSWRISSGVLPLGLTLKNAVCASNPCKEPARISGAPTSYGSYTFTVTLKSGDENVSKEFTLVVVQALNSPY